MGRPSPAKYTGSGVPDTTGRRSESGERSGRIVLAGVDTLHVGLRSKNARLRLRQVRELLEEVAHAPKGERLVRFSDGSDWAVGGPTRWAVGSVERGGIKALLGREGLENNPEVTVEVGSRACWELGLHGAWRAAQGIGRELLDCEPSATLVSRVDPCVDVAGFDFGATAREAWVAKLRAGRERGPEDEEDDRQRWYTATETNSLRWGSRASGAIVRVYDKVREIREQSGKTWLFPMWARKNGGEWPREVWRVELELKRKALRGEARPERSWAVAGPGLPVDTLEGLERALPAIFREYVTSRLRLCVPSDRDRNRSRWDLHPVWQAVADVPWREWAGLREGDHVAAEQAQADYRKLLSGAMGYMEALGAALSLRLDSKGEDPAEVFARVMRDGLDLFAELGRDWAAEVREKATRHAPAPAAAPGPVGAVA